MRGILRLYTPNKIEGKIDLNLDIQKDILYKLLFKHKQMWLSIPEQYLYSDSR